MTDAPARPGLAPPPGDCSFCAERRLVVPAAVGFLVPTPRGRIAVRCCAHHLSGLIDELLDAERQAGQGRRNPTPLRPRWTRR